MASDDEGVSLLNEVVAPYLGRLKRWYFGLFYTKDGAERVAVALEEYADREKNPSP